MKTEDSGKRDSRIWVVETMDGKLLGRFSDKIQAYLVAEEIPCAHARPE